MNKQPFPKDRSPLPPPESGPGSRHKARPSDEALAPASIVGIRARLGLSQEGFAQAFGISVDTLQNWEQGRRQPTGPAKVLLKLASRDPAAMLKSVA